MSRFARYRLLGVATLLMAPLSPTRAVIGDLNGDLKVTPYDATLALYAAGGRAAPPPPIVLNGDVAGGPGGTGDGRIDLVDAVRILRAATGLDPFPAPIISAGLTDSLMLSADATKNWNLPRAWWIRGNVTGPDLGDDPKPSLTVVFTPRANPSEPIHGAVTAGYVLPARSGVNDVALDLEYMKYGGAGLEAQYTARRPLLPSPVDVTADAVQNFSYAAPSAPGTLSGAVTAPGWDIYGLTLNLDDGSYAMAILENSPVDSYSLTSTPGTGYFSTEDAVGGADGATGLILELTGSPVTISAGAAGTANINLPALAPLIGQITAPSQNLTVGTLKSLSGGSYVETYSLPDDEGYYTLDTPTGDVRLSVTMDTYSSEGWSSAVYLQGAIVPTSGGVMDVTLPALPTLRTLSGTVRDAKGEPAENVEVYIRPAGNNLDLADGWYGAADVLTGPDGAYSIPLPNGTYTVELTPPAPFGPPSGSAARVNRGHRLWRARR